MKLRHCFPQVIDDYRCGSTGEVLSSRSAAADDGHCRTDRSSRERNTCRFGWSNSHAVVDFGVISVRFSHIIIRLTIIVQVDQVVEEIRKVHHPRQLIFFIDDNITSGLDEAKELMRALIPLRIRWVSQTAINVAHDDETLDLMKRSGCQGVLIGIESLSRETLHDMNKGFNLMKGGPAQALANMRRHGYPSTVPLSSATTTTHRNRSPSPLNLPGNKGCSSRRLTISHRSLGLLFTTVCETRVGCIYEAWWLDQRYRYNMIPFRPKSMPGDELARLCVGSAAKVLLVAEHFSTRRAAGESSQFVRLFELSGIQCLASLGHRTDETVCRWEMKIGGGQLQIAQ